MGLLSSYSLPAAPPLSETLEKSRVRVSSAFLSTVSNPSLRLFASLRFLARAPTPMAALPPHGVGENNSPIATIGSSSRAGEVKRVTKETNVHVKLNLDGSGVAECGTGIPFLDHMLDQLASHGLFDLHVKASGDTHIDDHHTNEDVALAIGTALLQSLGDRKGINRFGHFSAPLDEAAIEVILLVEHFFQSLVNTSGMTLHIRQLAGKNSHHIIEATFKAFARALRQATEFDLRRRGTVPSSKGVLSRS
ncbi:imidazoleglycerol-phosphate dehydratase 3, chloroplastic isoform X2 [Phoenix dactylifera]|uniref:Imidazoleglycerol-phosphate dehydratase n=1 Tax=Phoenix dactylifera TaxID=42345 RepID=A0A8B7CM06_PHODC|nr:imidazoleglycerol-phosphate dehydratase 3, chloroplastic isoform X2 [Phoenix dactylifera]